MATSPTSGSPQSIADPYDSLAPRLWVLAWLAVLSLVMTYPLALHFGEAIPGHPGDNLASLHDLWRFREEIVALNRWPEALSASGQSGALPFAGPDVLVANKVLVAPLLLWGDEVLAYNELVLLTTVLSGYGAYLLIVYLTGQPLAAAVGATAFALCPYRQHTLVAGWLPLLSTQWIPFAFLYAERGLREGRARHAALAGAFVGLGALTAWPYLVAVGLPLLAYALLRLRLGYGTVSRERIGRHLVLGIAVALLVSGPVSWALARGLAGASQTSTQPEGIAADLLALPGVYHPWWGARLWEGRAYPFSYPAEAPGMVYLGVVSGALAVFTLLTRHDEGSSASALFWTGVLATVLACGPVLRARGAVVTVTLPAGGAEALESFVDTLRGAPAGGEAVELRVLLPGLALQRLADSLGIPISFHPFGAVAALMVAVLAGMGVARISARWATAVLPGRHDPMVSAAGWNAGKIALIGAACMALVLADFAMAPLVGGLTVVEEQPLDRWLAAQDGPVMVIEYPLERNGGVARYHGRYHGGTSAYDALVTRGLSTHEEAQLEAFPHPESVAFLQRQGVTHLVVASEAYARVTGRSWAEARGALDVAPGVQLAGVVREEDSWRDESLTDAIDVGSWLVAGPRDTLYVYTLQR